MQLLRPNLQQDWFSLSSLIHVLFLIVSMLDVSLYGKTHTIKLRGMRHEIFKHIQAFDARFIIS